MVCLLLYCSVGEAYKRKIATTLQLPFAFLRKADATTCVVESVLNLFMVILVLTIAVLIQLL